MASHELDKDLWGGAEAFDGLLADIRARAGEFERNKRISQDIIERFRTMGVYRALVPKAYGGDEKTPKEFLLMVEAISAADGSAGWVASFGMNPAYLAALPPATVEKVWADGPDVVFAGGIFPPQAAPEKDGGYVVSGRWQFASGCHGASVFGVGILPQGGETLPRMAVLPREKVRIEEAWDVIGMVGTGSHDLVVENVFVPKEWTFSRGAKASIDAPFFRYPALAFAAQVLAVTTAGLAREALDILRNTAAGRASVTGAPNIGDRPYVQIELAKAEAKLRSSRAFFYEATDEAWSVISSRRPAEPGTGQPDPPRRHQHHPRMRRGRADRLPGLGHDQRLQRSQAVADLPRRRHVHAARFYGRDHLSERRGDVLRQAAAARLSVTRQTNPETAMNEMPNSRGAKAPAVDVSDLVLDDRVHSSLYSNPALFEAEMDKVFNSNWISGRPRQRGPRQRLVQDRLHRPPAGHRQPRPQGRDPCPAQPLPPSRRHGVRRQARQDQGFYLPLSRLGLFA